MRLPLLLGLCPQLRLAVPRRATVAISLRATLECHRIVRYILGDHGAGADIGALADLHRRDQRGIGADKGPLADRGLVLQEAVIVAGDGPGADVAISADMSVADVGKMVDRQLRRAADQTSIFLTDEAVKALPLLLAWPSANSSAEISRNDIA